jgi:hypothetical protein
MLLDETAELQDRLWELAVKEGELRDEAKSLGAVLP